MTDPCCNRILVDTGYIGADYAAHEADSFHVWLDDGQVCCLSGARRWHQVCYCKAGRWVDRDHPAARVLRDTTEEERRA